MMKQRVTRRDVALRAGVSETVVSYVLNANRYVDSEKKERVLRAVRELGYFPSPVARALKGKDAHHVLFIVDDMISEYFGSIISEMEKLVAGKGFLFSLACDRGDENFVQTVCNWSFDGIVIGSATIREDDIQKIIDTGMPTVILAMNDYPRFCGRYGLVFTGLMEGSLKIMECFRAKGRKRIAFLDSFCIGDAPVDRTGFRYIGYKVALNGQEEIVIDRCEDSARLRKKIAEVYEGKHFDALFCRTDRMAAEAMLALSAMGLSVPDDVSVVGVNNSRIAMYTRPRLTSLAIRKDEVARATLQLFALLKKNREEEVLTVQLETDLIERESV